MNGVAITFNTHTHPYIFTKLELNVTGHSNLPPTETNSARTSTLSKSPPKHGVRLDGGCALHKRQDAFRNGMRLEMGRQHN